MTEPGSFDTLRTRLRLLTADVAQLDHDLSALAPDTDDATAPLDQPVMSAAAPASSGWQQMPAALAVHAWHDLTGWVEELIGRYELHETIPTCWYQHGPMVEELHALQLAWYGAYAAPEALFIDPLSWHEHLNLTLARLRDWDTHGCTSGRHRSAPPPPVDPAAADLRQQHIQADVDRRAALEPATTSATPP